MRALAWCRLGEVGRIALGHGDLIGRSGSAALRIDDARVSEAHALVSLRGGALQLLALRGRFRVAGKVRADVALVEGLAVELAEGVVLEVDELVVPDAVLGVEGDGLPRQALAGTCALYVRPVPQLRPGWQPDADAVLWSLDDAWRIRPAGGPTRALSAGAVVDLGGWTLRAVEVALNAAGPARTHVGFCAPLHLSAAVDTVTLTVEGADPTVIGGLPGRLLAELVAIGGPCSWEAVARELWREDDASTLRRRWDVALARLRARLRTIGVRDDLVHADGAGHVELLLRPGDRTVVQDG